MYIVYRINMYLTIHFYYKTDELIWLNKIRHLNMAV